jgi:hypothetical protein
VVHSLPSRPSSTTSTWRQPPDFPPPLAPVHYQMRATAQHLTIVCAQRSQKVKIKKRKRNDEFEIDVRRGAESLERTGVVGREWRYGAKCADALSLPFDRRPSNRHAHDQRLFALQIVAGRTTGPICIFCQQRSLSISATYLPP